MTNWPVGTTEPQAQSQEERIARLEALVLYLCQLLGVRAGPEGADVEPDLEGQHQRFADAARGKVLRRRGR